MFFPELTFFLLRVVWLLIALIRVQEHLGSSKPAKYSTENISSHLCFCRAATMCGWVNRGAGDNSREESNGRNLCLLMTLLILPPLQSIAIFSHHVPVSHSFWPDFLYLFSGLLQLILPIQRSLHTVSRHLKSLGAACQLRSSSLFPQYGNIYAAIVGCESSTGRKPFPALSRS